MLQGVPTITDQVMPSQTSLGVALSVALSLGALSVPTGQSRPHFARQTFTNRPANVMSVRGVNEATAAIAKAVAARDRAELGPWLADDVVVADEDLSGEAYLARLEDGEWQDIARAIEVGYNRSGDEYHAPYTFQLNVSPANMRDHEMDAAVIAAGVRVRSGPDATSRVIDTVSYAIVRRSDQDEPGPWCRIIAPDGTVGFVDDRYVALRRGMIVWLGQRAGRWKIVTIGYAGD